VIIEGMQKVKPGIVVKAVSFEGSDQKTREENKNTTPQTVKRTGGGE
jgi:hypothetical protein